MKGVFSMASFRKLSSGWKVTVSKRDPAGNLHQTSKSGFKTKNDARVYAAQIEAQNDSSLIAHHDVVFLQYYIDWYKTYKENRVAASNLKRYIYVSHIIEKNFGNLKLKSITRNQYQHFINGYGKNHAKDTVRKTNNIIRACVKAAMIDEIIRKDFTQGIELVYDEKRTLKVEYLSVAEINKLIKDIEDGLDTQYTSRYMILTAIYTGMRLGEIQALTWKDISFKQHTISINKSWDYHAGGGFKSVKTKSSYRIIRVGSSLLNFLKQLKINNSKMVFENKARQLPSSNAVNKALHSIMEKCEIQKNNFHFHSLRHSHVAYLLFKGVSLYAISKRLGHSNMSITAEKYAYLIAEYKARSDDRIEKLTDSLGQQEDNKIIFFNSN
jgi:integrase